MVGSIRFFLHIHFVLRSILFLFRLIVVAPLMKCEIAKELWEICCNEKLQTTVHHNDYLHVFSTWLLPLFFYIFSLFLRIAFVIKIFTVASIVCHKVRQQCLQLWSGARVSAEEKTAQKYRMKMLKHLAKTTYLLLLNWLWSGIKNSRWWWRLFAYSLFSWWRSKLRICQVAAMKIDRVSEIRTGTHTTHTHVFISWWSFKCIKQSFELVMIVVYSTNQVRNESLVSIESVATPVVLSTWTNGAHQQRRRITAEKKKVGIKWFNAPICYSVCIWFSRLSSFVSK